jgi:cytoskeletal protein CcmA (bactofilin family)
MTSPHLLDILPFDSGEPDHEGDFTVMFFRKQKAVGNDNRTVVDHQPTHIGPDSTIDGNLVSDGEVRIEGTVRGIVKARACHIAESGVVEGEVSAEEVFVQGRVIGPLRAQHVHLQPGAWVEGDITSETIAIETGARLSGSVWQGEARNEPVADTHHNGYEEPSALFSGSLWNSRPDEEFRPLKAIRPRALNGSRG